MFPDTTYNTREDLEQYTRLTPQGFPADHEAARDAILDRALATAKSCIDIYCNRQFNNFTGALVLAPRYESPELLIGDIESVSAIKIRSEGDSSDTADWDELDSGDWEFLPKDANYLHWPYRSIMRTDGGVWPLMYADREDYYRNGRPLASVEVTGKHGWMGVPPAIKEASLLTADRCVKANVFMERDPSYDAKMLMMKYRLTVMR